METAVLSLAALTGALYASDSSQRVPVMIAAAPEHVRHADILARGGGAAGG